MPFNEAIWIPDAVYEKIKFELNLPSTARQYLDESNLPGYPETVTYNHKMIHATIESVVMPRLIYDIWPYYVPHCPLYSNVIFPYQNRTTKINSLDMNSLIQNSLPQTNLPVYHRQIKSKEPVVDAQAVNQSIIGSLLTPNELNRRINQQIDQHRSLLNNHDSRSCSRSRSRSRSKSRECSMRKEASCCSECQNFKQNIVQVQHSSPPHHHHNNQHFQKVPTTQIQPNPVLCSFYNSMNHFNKVNQSHDHQHEINLNNHNKNQFHHYVDHGYSKNSHHNHHHRSHNNHKHDTNDFDDSNHTKNNKYYDSYVQSIQNLYDSVKHDDLKRSKSVTFSDKDDHNGDDDDEGNISDPEIELEFDAYGHRILHKSISSNTDVSFQKRDKKKLISANNNSKLTIPNRRHWRCFH